LRADRADAGGPERQLKAPLVRAARRSLRAIPDRAVGARRSSPMSTLVARSSTTHRKYVVIGWILLLVSVNAFAQSAGTSYSNNFTLPNSGAQRAADLLQKSFPAQAGDRDTIAFKASSGSVTDPAVRARMSAMFAEVAKLPHVTAVISPY